ncbi:MAG: CHAT domain-containing protein, partial [Theionarchaea archaeon]|nr:CHAT domain-containing protein [Theionarchaea archaeon]
KKELEDKYPEAYATDVALIFNNLGILFRETHNFSKAQKAYSEAMKRFKQACRWLDMAGAAYNLWMVTHDRKTLEASRRLLEIAILLSEEEKYKYALKRINEEIYLDLIENDMTSLGAFEALRDPRLLSLLSIRDIQQELDKAQKDIKFQESLVENVMGREIPYLESIPPDFPDNLLFIYVHNLQDRMLFFIIDNEAIKKFTCRKAFFDTGMRVIYLLMFQSMTADNSHPSHDVEKFDEFTSKWFEMLPQGLKDRICEKDHIAFSPDGASFHLPLETMQTHEGTLCLEKTVVRAAGLNQFLSLLPMKPSFDSSLMVGNPWPQCEEEKMIYSPPSDSKKIILSSLIDSEEEILALRKNLPNPRVLLKQDATGETFLSEISRHSIIHFSGHGSMGRILFLAGPYHGFSPPFEPQEFSTFRKAERNDGRKIINMMEEWHPVTDLDLYDVPVKKGALVFLHACETGWLEYVGGGKYQGLPAVFLKNGAQSVISSLIPLIDEHSKDFSCHFYDALLNTHSPIESLKRARIAMKEAHGPHLSWAPYIHYGPPV